MSAVREDINEDNEDEEEDDDDASVITAASQAPAASSSYSHQQQQSHGHGTTQAPYPTAHPSHATHQQPHQPHHHHHPRASHASSTERVYHYQAPYAGAAARRPSTSSTASGKGLGHGSASGQGLGQGGLGGSSTHGGQGKTFRNFTVPFDRNGQLFYHRAIDPLSPLNKQSHHYPHHPHLRRPSDASVGVGGDKDREKDRDNMSVCSSHASQAQSCYTTPSAKSAVTSTSLGFSRSFVFEGARLPLDHNTVGTAHLVMDLVSEHMYITLYHNTSTHNIAFFQSLSYRILSDSSYTIISLSLLLL